FDAGHLTLLLANMFDLARIKYTGRAFGRRRFLQIACEFGDFLLEILQRTESRDIENRHEASVIVAAGRLDAEAKSGEQAAQHFDHRGQSAALVAFSAAERQQR